MSIKVSLEDNSVHSLVVEFIQLSSHFKCDSTAHIHTSEPVFNKIKEFGEYYLPLSKKDRKIFDNPETIWEKENPTQEWCNNFLVIPNNILIELTNQSFKLNIKPLLDLCCYKIAQIINVSEISDLREKFGVENDFNQEETEQLERETEWIN